MPGPLDRRDRRDKLSRRYVRMRDEDPSALDELDDAPYDIDDVWDPGNAAGPLDFHLQLVWEQVLSVALAPTLADFFPEAERPARAATEPKPTAPVAIAELPAALQQHLDRAIAKTSRRDYLEQLRRAGTLDDIRAAVRAHPVLGRWFADRRGPAVMALVLAPFWLRPLVAWSPPDSDELDTVTRSLVDHLFAKYPLPAPLYHAWSSESLPVLKWATWTVLLGHGASLHKAAPLFGWQITARFTHHLLAAPAHLATADAVMWAEVARLGGTKVEYDRLAAHPAYRIDPTSGTAAPAPADEVRWDEERTNTTPGFWRATVGWLAHYRADLDDADCQQVLDWAMHLHTEDLVHARPEAACFSWHGRIPAAALADATRYQDFLTGRQRAGGTGTAPLAWKRRGWDWEHVHDGVTWSIRELVTDTELLDEGWTMRHCVSSYSYTCSRGEATIFTLRRNGARCATVQVDPASHGVVQARGVRNRNLTREEHAALERWISMLNAHPV